MSDPNIEDFRRRLGRISEIQAASAGDRRQGRPRLWLRLLAVLLAGGVLVKAGLFAALGEAAYVDRVARMSAGSAPERLAATLLRPDPVSRTLVDFVTR